ncbi:MAG: beta-propeller fold lactonase family protein [Leptospirales bacterium]|nr:beta-propeller fold lactonase family protein [Leptospirales bacterium]
MENLYTVNYDGNDLYHFTIGSGGVPVLKRTYSGLPATPSAVSSDQTGRAIYVSYNSPAAIQVFRVEDASGDLTLVQTISAGLSASREPATIDMQNRSLYQVNGNDTISVFALNDRGLLSTVANSATTAAGAARFGAMHPSNQFFYSANLVATGTISRHAVNSDASLALLGTTAVGGQNPSQLAFDRTGSNLYTTGFSAGENIYSFQVNSATGNLTALTPVTCGNSCYQTWVHPSNRFVFAGGTAGLLLYARDGTTGQLSSLGVVSGPSFRILTANAAGTFLHTIATGNPGTLRTFSVTPSGDGIALLYTQNLGNCTTACGGALVTSYVY